MSIVSKSLFRFTSFATSVSRSADLKVLKHHKPLWQLTTIKPKSTVAIYRFQRSGLSSFLNGFKHLHKTPPRNLEVFDGGFTHKGVIIRQMHTKGERELVEFLTEEILNERKAQNIKSVATKLDDFAVKLNGAEVELIKQTDKEKISINFNVNHTVDTEDEPEIDTTADKPDVGEMRSKPRFEVDIKRGNQTVSFTCSFLVEPAQGDEYNDVFGIDEVTIFQGEWSDKVYAVAGDVLDGHLYDLLMNLLDEKGVTNEFVQKLSDLATAYEHSCYIGMLEGISKFAVGNYEKQVDSHVNTCSQTYRP